MQMATGNFMQKPKTGVSFCMKTENSAGISVLWSALRTLSSFASVMCYAYPCEHRIKHILYYSCQMWKNILEM